MARQPEDALPLNPRAFYILLALAERNAHGYAIARTVETATGGKVTMTAGTLYPLIRQMVADGWITDSHESSDDPRRRVYRLTRWGRLVAKAEASRLSEVVRRAHACQLLAIKT